MTNEKFNNAPLFFGMEGGTRPPQKPPYVCQKPPYVYDYHTCCQCEQKKTPLITVGEPEDYESRTAHLCLECLTEAVSLCLRERSRIESEKETVST